MSVIAGEPRRAVVYARISDDTEGRAAGVTRQVEDATALAERLGWTLAPGEPLIDNDISASTKSKARRPNYERLMEGVRAGEWDGVLFYSNSRLTRRPAEYENVIALVEATGVRLASCSSGAVDLSTADGRMIGRMLAAQDAAEAERIGERITRAFKQRREQGLPNPVRRSFGFAPGGVDVIPEEAEAIRLGAHIILEGGSLGDVMREFDQKGIRPLTATGWNRVTVRRILTRPRVAGLVSQGDEVIGVGNFEAILERDVWEKVVALISDRSRTMTKEIYAKRVHLLAGFLYCGLCARPVKVNALRKPDGSLRPESFVVCSRSQFGCGKVKRNLAHLEGYIFTVVREELVKAAALPAVLVEDDDVLGIAQEIARRDQALADIVELIEATRVEFADQQIPIRDFVPLMRLLNERHDKAQAALEEIQSESPSEPLSADDLAEWDSEDFDARREILEHIIDNVVLQPVGRVGPVRAKAAIPDTTEINFN